MLRLILHKTIKISITILIFCMSGLTHSYSPYSNQELDELEKEFIEQINNSYSVIRNPLASQYINTLGKQLAKNGQMKAPHFFIVKSNDINAFAGPGGYIGINTQLILTTDNESELAGVMAHEMAHVRQHHLYRMIEHQKQMHIPKLASMLAAIALGVVNPAVGSGALIATMSGFEQDTINFVRSSEKEADRIGIDMLIRSELNPRGMADFFKKMQQNSRYFYDNVPEMLRTHPLDDSRIAEAENRTQNFTNKKHINSLDYNLFKELIRVSVTGHGKQLLDYYNSQCFKESIKEACEYGRALTYLHINNFKRAEEILTGLYEKDNNNLFYAIGISQSYVGLKESSKAVDLLRKIYTDSPDNYAVNIAFADSLQEDKDPIQAASVLLKASRIFKNDLSVCQQLARAESASGQKSYAYFTEARCQSLQGNKNIALRQLNLAKKLAKNDRLLTLRIDAIISDLKNKNNM